MPGDIMLLLFSVTEPKTNIHTARVAFDTYKTSNAHGVHTQLEKSSLVDKIFLLNKTLRLREV